MQLSLRDGGRCRTGEIAGPRWSGARVLPQELQIARFVAEGHSNKEVAAQLFLSPRTIDYHLRDVFGKPGITSRTQLARFTLGAREDAVPASAPVPV